ncbi:MAG: ATP-dependent Clp protease ATP-binding subunit, partial [Myxococcota bacterium]
RTPEGASPPRGVAPQEDPRGRGRPPEGRALPAQAPSPPEPAPAAAAPETALAPADPPAARRPEEGWLLPVSDFPWLSSMGRNLSFEAARGGLDRLVGRDAEVEQLADILGKRKANNPCLIGEPGVGKTSIVEGLAARWVQGSPADQERVVVAVDVGRLLMGTHLRGSFSEKLEGLREEVERAEGKVVVFFDEIHTLVGAGTTGEGALDAANELKTVLAQGRFPCIGATTPSEYDRYVNKDPALARRFVPVLVEEPTAEQAETMLFQLLPAYSEHHGVGYTPESIRTAVRLSVRFVPDRQLPDKAIALLDLAGSRVARAGRSEVGAQDLATLVSERVGVAPERLLETDRDALLALEDRLSERIVGHRGALQRIASVIRRHAAGFSRKRPRGSFLLFGPTGVGKTETAKAVADILYGGALVRFDLSELSEAHSVARLVGAPPGYVGHEEGGQLTDAIRRRPASILLFDEVEKAHPRVLQLLLQILDEGRLTDGHGRTTDFCETVVFLTTNLGGEAEARRSIGFSDGVRAPDDAATQAARRGLSPELWGRIDEKLHFGPLGPLEITRIARHLVGESSERLQKERGISFELDRHALAVLVEQGGVELRYGARPLRRALGQLVEAPIAARILEGRLHAGEHVVVSRREGGGGLVFRVGSEPSTLSQRPTPALSLAPKRRG